MSTASRNAASASMSGSLAGQQAPAERSYFEQQRDLILKDIGISFEHVLANINKLNRSLEGVIAVGNEFSSVEALWSQFEGVMAKDVDVDVGGEKEAGRGDGDGAGEKGKMGVRGAGSEVGEDEEAFDREEEENTGMNEGRRR